MHTLWKDLEESAQRTVARNLDETTGRRMCCNINNFAACRDKLTDDIITMRTCAFRAFVADDHRLLPVHDHINQNNAHLVQILIGTMSSPAPANNSKAPEFEPPQVGLNLSTRLAHSLCFILCRPA